MKKIISSFLLLMLIVSTVAAQRGFVIEGKLDSEKYDGQKVFLQKLDDENKPVNVDSTIVRGAAFNFKGNTSDKALLRTIAIDKPGIERYRPALIFVEPGKNTVVLDSVLVATVGGTQLNERFQKNQNELVVIQKEITDMLDSYDDKRVDGKLLPEDEKAINDDYNEIMKRVGSVYFALSKDNMTNSLGEYIFKTNYPRMNEVQIGELLALSTSDFKNSEHGKKAAKYKAILEATKVGMPFIDIKSLSPDGKEIALSDYAGKGNVVLVDFWASWCGPCRKEMPHVVEAYAKYKDKGFEIFGVSLDSDAKSWTKALETMNMTWPQISDLKGWKSEPAGEYGVRSIPSIYLLDKDGTIIAKNLRRDELIAKLSELLD